MIQRSCFFMIVNITKYLIHYLKRNSDITNSDENFTSAAEPKFFTKLNL